MKKYIKRLSPYCKKIIKLFRKDFKLLLPQLYLLGIVIGFIITLLYAAFPKLIICTTLFGQEFCTPTGIFIGLTVSLPGYIIAGNVLSKLPTLPALPSFVIVVATSFGFYYLLGLLIDKYKKGTYDQRVRLMIAAIFAALLIALISLI